MSCVEKRFLVVCCFLGVLCLAPVVSGAWVKSSIDTTENWKLLTSYCFLSRNGRLNFFLKYPVSYGIQQLLLYPDINWENVSRSTQNCMERMSGLSKVNNQIIDLTNRITGSRSAGCTVLTQDGVDYYKCTDQVTFVSSRERRWYIVVARCAPSEGGVEGLKLDYSFNMTNDLPSSYTSSGYGDCDNNGHRAATPDGWQMTVAVIALHYMLRAGKYL